jgi:phage tail-like protein
MALTARVDPIRNFKFNVQASLSDKGDPFADFGFMSVDGIAMNTEMVAYREGGMNTTPHKLPGQTDFSPLTMSTGIYYNRAELWGLAKMMFSVQHGGGTLGMTNGQITEFRYDLVVRVLGHPVTDGKESGSVSDIAGALLAYRFVNCWTASVGFSGLNASGNEIVVQQMTVHHEGFNVYFGNEAAVSMPALPMEPTV